MIVITTELYAAVSLHNYFMLDRTELMTMTPKIVGWQSFNGFFLERTFEDVFKSDGASFLNFNPSVTASLVDWNIELCLPENLLTSCWRWVPSIKTPFVS